MSELNPNNTTQFIIYQNSKQNISHHINRINEEGELVSTGSNCQKLFDSCARSQAPALIVKQKCLRYTVIPAGIAGIQNTGM